MFLLFLKNPIVLYIFWITFTFMHLADAFIQSDLQLHLGYTFSLVHVFPWNRTHNLLRSWRNALPLSHTGTHRIMGGRHFSDDVKCWGLLKDAKASRLKWREKISGNIDSFIRPQAHRPFFSPLLVTRKVLHCFSCCPSTENYNQKSHNVALYQYFIFWVKK